MRFDSITVTQLCKEAGIVRQTFYRHYNNQLEILENHLAGIANDFLTLIDKMPVSVVNLPQTVVQELKNNQTLFEMIYWAHAEEAAITVLASDMMRVTFIDDRQNDFQGFVNEIVARNVFNFSRVMLKYPTIDTKMLVKLYSLMVPNPQDIFQHLFSSEH
ncbi:TetR/AcrR family transcriptional regulator [Lentilactobacillus kosonis]|uniref:HTH tetR-type domain-containing protein n=1 Tax=Lentilactobacillus kosonis TaxID=2810561 RepID=A0A401FHX8_9LACO|nr:TetR/AcrR family transcriptional regulator [Lentilactobacillus kosonis]GAY71952.1 hypothetical protein NBRC111893_98 [Lentilactobacillus kosonis]